MITTAQGIFLSTRAFLDKPNMEYSEFLSSWWEPSSQASAKSSLIELSGVSQTSPFDLVCCLGSGLDEANWKLLWAFSYKAKITGPARSCMTSRSRFSKCLMDRVSERACRLQIVVYSMSRPKVSNYQCESIFSD